MTDTELIFQIQSRKPVNRKNLFPAKLLSGACGWEGGRVKFMIKRRVECKVLGLNSSLEARLPDQLLFDAETYLCIEFYRCYNLTVM